MEENLAKNGVENAAENSAENVGEIAGETPAENFAEAGAEIPVEAAPIDDLSAKLKEAEDKYIRAYAEFENIKKRLEKEKYQAIDYASEQFAKDLLGAIDALDMALKIEDADHFEQMKEGVVLTRANLLKTFEKHGISAITHDQGFDPNLHEAIMQANDENLDENAIAMVLQQGYKYKDRILRPSLVSVNKR
ncbi:MAG: nucleotide exchange factor GrpE [Helicobacteraceae bacterium]|jgi:molecular chaperone GrpE|nr:nucleotide exchange factor GrpE [Helicobacteraceae bacterium]